MAQFELNGVNLSVPAELLTDRIRMKMKKGGYEGNEARAAQLSVEHGDKILDLGSGVGYIATLCAMIAGAENVVTVEANPELLEVVRANLDGNDCPEATVLHGAVVGDKTKGKTVKLKLARAFWASSVAGKKAKADEVVEVPALRIGNLLKTYTPNVVMMDVEGIEKDLFDAAWPDYVRVVTLELHPKRYPDTVIKRIFDCMSASGLIYAPDMSRGAMVGFCREGMSEAY